MEHGQRGGVPEREIRSDINVRITLPVFKLSLHSSNFENTFMQCSFVYYFVLTMSPCRFPKADVFETHVSEVLAVNQCWDVRSDVYFVGIFFLSVFGKKLDSYVEVKNLFKSETIN